MPQRAALVTGASSGIGLAIARVLGEEGLGLTVVARRPEKLAGAVEQLRAAGCEVEEVAGNMAEEADIQRVVAAHRERWGRLDVLVNSAGVTVSGSGTRSNLSPRSRSTSSTIVASAAERGAGTGRCSPLPSSTSASAPRINARQAMMANGTVRDRTATPGML